MCAERCDGCDKPVQVSGGIADLWTTDGSQTDGMTLELTDGSEHFLCFECIDRLPDDSVITEADIADLPTDTD